MKITAPGPVRMGLVSIIAAGLIGAISNLLVNTLPAYLTIVAHARGFIESEVGFCGTAEVGGIALGTVLSAMLPSVVARLNWRRTVGIGIAVLITGNLLSVYITDLYPFLAMRLVAGVGAGIALAVVYATFAEGDAARSMSMANVAQMAVGALAIPSYTAITQTHGVNGLFFALAGLGVLGLFAGWSLPAMSAREADAEAHAQHASEKISMAGWLAIASVFLFFIGCGCVYAYLGFMGIAWGSAESSVDQAMSMMMLASMTAAILVAVMGSRFGFVKPLAIGFAIISIVLVLFLLGKPQASFSVGIALFGFSMSFIMPFHFEAVTKVDDSSSAAMLVSAATLCGYAVGPTIAGFLVTPDFGLVNSAGLSFIALSLVTLIHATRMHKIDTQRLGMGAIPAVSM